jgi:pyruvate kinase
MTSKPTSKRKPSSGQKSPWDQGVCLELLDQLWALRTTILDSELRYSNAIEKVGEHQKASARNLVHYLAMRATDLRSVQEKLSWLGVSSMGRSESHVLANIDKVIGILHRLTGQDWEDHSQDEPAGRATGRRLLEEHTELLLGPKQYQRSVRIMVTLGSETATDYGLVRRLVDAGMDVARINCAHDDAIAWHKMAQFVQRAAKASQRDVKILMDLGGPKIRTGLIKPGPKVLKFKPTRDAFGNTLIPSRIRICATAADGPKNLKLQRIVVDIDWLSRLRVGKHIDFNDARDKKRSLMVVECDAEGVIAECMETYYLTPDTELTYTGSNGRKQFVARPLSIEANVGKIHLHRGDHLLITPDGIGSEPPPDGNTESGRRAMAHIACTLPQVFGQVRAGERVWLDDGRIGGIVRKASAKSMEVEIVQARDGGESLLSDKGINFPDSHLELPALTEKDKEDLKTVAQVADLVGLSFVQDRSDVHQLLASLKVLSAEHVGIVLKIETLKGFENLPSLMLAAMAAPSSGVMIARGDLAVECGFERMVEVQEEILWCSEAAHMPVIWATQVLESLAKDGIPSRAEISDAGMGVRAECVMLNKGPYITDAIHMLNDILRRMAGHQDKKNSLLRALRAWGVDESL